jgi:hypothetical protein
MTPNEIENMMVRHGAQEGDLFVSSQASLVGRLIESRPAAVACWAWVILSILVFLPVSIRILMR